VEIKSWRDSFPPVFESAMAGTPHFQNHLFVTLMLRGQETHSLASAFICLIVLFLMTGNIFTDISMVMAVDFLRR